MDTTELQKSCVHNIYDLVQHLPNTVCSRGIIKKVTGGICFFSIAAGKKLARKTVAYDRYIQVIDGAAAITINKKTHQLHSGQGIIIPAHCAHGFFAHEPFKMIATVIKSQYEE
jgi:quercetin dioxygenase-like cupin family protein